MSASLVWQVVPSPVTPPFEFGELFRQLDEIGSKALPLVALAGAATGVVLSLEGRSARATSAVGDAIEDGVEVVRRAARQGGDAAEEFLNDTTQRIQRHPVLTVATTFAVGFTTGALVGWIIKRR